MSIVGQQYQPSQSQYQYQRSQNIFKITGDSVDNHAVATTRIGGHLSTVCHPKSVLRDEFISLFVDDKLQKGLTEELTSKPVIFTDMITSEDTIMGFHVAAGAEIADSLTVQLLNTGLWPTQSVATCTLPSEILGV
ncbi:hypothetical protein KY285_017627 [Solanum tuberosum]|nr:hypothetical protein KY285_017627 [Solanum tuberosum]